MCGRNYTTADLKILFSKVKIGLQELLVLDFDQNMIGDAGVEEIVLALEPKQDKDKVWGSRLMFRLNPCNLVQQHVMSLTKTHHNLDPLCNVYRFLIGP